MPISITGSPTGIPPVFNWRNRFTIFEDFVRSDPVNLYPFETDDGEGDDFQPDASGVYANASRVGVFTCDRAARGELGSIRDEAFEFYLVEFATLDLEWRWYLSSFTGGVPETNIAFGLGTANSNINTCGGSQMAGFICTTDWTAVCGAANSIAANILVPRQRNTAGVVTTVGASVGIGTLVGQWNTCRMLWTAGVGIEYFINGTSLGTGPIPDWISTVDMKWSYASSNTVGAAQPDIIAFDWLKIIATMNR